MFISVVHKDNMNHPIAWLNVFENADTSKKIEGDRILEFVTIEDNLKTPYLYQKDMYKLIADGQIYTPIQVVRVAESGTVPKVQVEAEHTSYSLNDTTFELYEHEGNVVQLMNFALAGTGFVFDATDIPTSELKKLKVPFTNSRYIVNRIAREFQAKIIYDNNKISLFRSLSNATGIRLTVDKNLESIKRIISHKEGQETVTYEVDVNTGRLESLETVDIGDALIVLDNERARSEIDRVVVEVRKNLLTDKVSDLVLGDPNPKFSDTILDLISPPILEEVEKMIGDGVITEVIHQQVVTVETAHILNAWIKNLFVEYLETNMDARLDAFTIDRHFIRIEDVKEEMVQQILNPNEVEDLKIKDPRGNGAEINVYFTAVGDHADAYRYFTITHPKSIHKDLTDTEVEAFKVKVKKVVSESIMYSKNFQVVKMADGSETYGVIELIGQGTDTTGETNRGKGFRYKEQRGQVIGTYNENNDGITAILFDGVDCVPKYYDMNKKDFVPLVNNWIGGDGNVVFHADKTTLTESDMTGKNILHVSYSTTGSKIVGTSSTLFTSGLTLLGVETSTVLPPIISQNKLYIYYNGIEKIPFEQQCEVWFDSSPTRAKFTKLPNKIVASNTQGSGGMGSQHMLFTGLIQLSGYAKLKARIILYDTSDYQYKPSIALAVCKQLSYTGEVQGNLKAIIEEWANTAYKFWKIPEKPHSTSVEIEMDIPTDFTDGYVVVVANSAAYSKIKDFGEVTEVWLENIPVVEEIIYENGVEKVPFTQYTDAWFPVSPTRANVSKEASKLTFSTTIGGGSNGSMYSIFTDYMDLSKYSKVKANIILYDVGSDSIKPSLAIGVCKNILYKGEHTDNLSALPYNWEGFYRNEHTMNTAPVNKSIVLEADIPSTLINGHISVSAILSGYHAVRPFGEITKIWLE